MIITSQTLMRMNGLLGIHLTRHITVLTFTIQRITKLNHTTQMLKQEIKNGKIYYFYLDNQVSPSKYFELRKQLSDGKRLELRLQLRVQFNFNLT